MHEPAGVVEIFGPHSTVYPYSVEYPPPPPPPPTQKLKFRQILAL